MKNSIDIIHGNGLSIESIYKFLHNSYEEPTTQLDIIDSFNRNHSLSSKNIQVYHNSITFETVISHRGTNKYDPCDWLNNLAYQFNLYEFTSRYKHAKIIHSKTEAKYGCKNIYTIGHSQGAILAEKLGKNSRNIITYNRPITIIEALLCTTEINHYDIRSSFDIISIFQPLQRKSNPDIIIKSITSNLFLEHSFDTIINDSNKDIIIGKKTICIKQKN